MRYALVLVVIIVATLPLAGQSWAPPRTAWGDPDLQGFWPVADLLSVPFERPANLGTRATLTDEELAQLPAEFRTPGVNEMVHEARLIHLDGRPHVGTGVRSYMGDSHEENYSMPHMMQGSRAEEQ